MLQFEELKLRLVAHEEELANLADALGLEKMKNEIAGLEEQQAQEGFWDDIQNSQKVLQKAKNLKDKLAAFEEIESSQADTLIMIEMAEEENDASLADEVAKTVEELNAKIEDSLLGQRVVKAFANEEIENAKFEEGNQDFLRIKTETYWVMGIFSTSTRVFDGLMNLVVILGGGYFLMKGQILPGDMVAYIMYVSTLIATIRKIIEFAEQFQRGITGIERFYEIMDSSIEIFDEPGAVELENPKGEISFDNVSFAYSDDQNIVFTGLNLHINKGEKLWEKLSVLT